MKNINNRILLWICCLFGSSACSLDQEETIPVEVFIDTVTFNDTQFGQQDYQEIVDVWVWEQFDNKRTFVGTFTPPTKVPIRSANARIFFNAGILGDGIAAFRVNHLLFSADTLDLNGRNVPTTFIPSFTYNENIVPPENTFVEDFEDGSLSISNAGSSDAIIRIADSDPSQAERVGNRHARIEAITNTGSIGFKSTQKYDIRREFTPVYVEFDYKSSVRFFAGLNVNLENSEERFANEIILTPNANWTKIYLDVTNEVNLGAGALTSSTFQVMAVTDTTVRQGDYIAVDNLRLLYLE